MGFFDTLRRALGGEHAHPGGKEANPRLSRAWGLDDDQESGRPTPASDLAADGGVYDQKNWRKKLKRILDELPDSKPEWAELMAEARALHFPPDWLLQCQVEEFMLLIRRAVSDRHFTEDEHRKLDLARDLIGIPEAEAEAALQAVIAEAQDFFGTPVKEG